MYRNCTFMRTGYPYLAKSAGNIYENLRVISNEYGMVPQSSFEYADNIQFIDCNNGMLVGYGSLTMSKLKMINCTYSVLLSPNAYGRIVNFIDSEIDINSMHTANIYDGSCEMNLKTTFNATIQNGAGGELTIEDKDGNVVFNEALVADSMTEDEFIYFIAYIYNADGVTEEYITTEYHPFTLKVTKSGYQDLVIPDIMVTAGVPTTVFGKMEEEILQINTIDVTHCSSELSENGTIIITAKGGATPYEYSIDDGDTYYESGVFSNLSSGVYRIRIKDNDGEETESLKIELKAYVYPDDEIELSLSEQSIDLTLTEETIELTLD
jgi:hypothetical protein